MAYPGFHIRRQTPTVDTIAYSDNDQLGSLITFTNMLDIGRTGLLKSVTLVLESGTPAAMNLYLFRASPTIASTDNNALDISDTEMTSKFLGHVNLPVTADTFMVETSSNSVVTVKGIDLVIDSSDGNLYGILEATAAITFSASNDLTVILGVEQA